MKNVMNKHEGDPTDLLPQFSTVSRRLLSKFHSQARPCDYVGLTKYQIWESLLGKSIMEKEC